MRRSLEIVVVIVAMALAVVGRPTVAGAEAPRPRGAASGPRGLAWSRARSMFAAGRVALRLPDDMNVELGGDRATLDWGDARFTLEVVELDGGDPADVRANVAPELAGRMCARVERLAAATAWNVTALVPRVPPRVGDRELVLVAYVTAATGAVASVRFYVDGPGFDDHVEWTALARSIAMTMTPVRVPVHHDVPHARRIPDLVVPADWHVLVDADDVIVIMSPHPGPPECRVRDGELDAVPIANRGAVMVAGRLLGTDLYWSFWKVDAVYRAEALVGARPTGRLHVLCSAPTAADLRELRAVVEHAYARPW